MGSKLIQFRLSGKELEALEARAGDESISLFAQRLLKEALGMSTSLSTPVDVEAIRQIVRDEVEALSGTILSLQDEHDRLVKEVATLKKPLAPEQTRWSQTILAVKNESAS